MAALRERFAARALGQADLIAGHAETGDRTGLRELCHGMAGTAGTFGFAPLGEAARAVEEAIDEAADDSLLERLTGQLLAELSKLPQGR